MKKGKKNKRKIIKINPAVLQNRQENELPQVIYTDEKTEQDSKVVIFTKE